MKKIFVAAITVTALVLLTAASILAAEEAVVPQTLKVGDTIKDDIKAATLDGDMVPLRSMLDSDYTVFQFMTTACGACQAELTDLVKLEKKLNGKFKIVAIAMDTMGAQAVNAYESKFNFGVIYLTNSAFTLPPRFGLDFTPSFVVVDKGGKILFTKEGYMATRMAGVLARVEDVMK